MSQSDTLKNMFFQVGFRDFLEALGYLNHALEAGEHYLPCLGTEKCSTV